MNLGPDFDLAVRLKAVEDAIARLQANPYGAAFSSTQSDGTEGLRIARDTATGATAMTFFQGPTTGIFAYPDGAHHPVFLYMGQLDASKVPIAVAYDTDAGMVVCREDGVAMLVLSNNGGVQVLDKFGSLVLATDETNGGLATSLNYPVPVTTSPDGNGVMSWAGGARQAVGFSNFVLYHTRVQWDASFQEQGSAQLVFTAPDLGDIGPPIVIPEVDGQTWSNGAAGFTGIAEVIALPASWIGHQITATVYLTGTGANPPAALTAHDLFGVGTATNVFQETVTTA